MSGGHSFTLVVFFILGKVFFEATLVFFEATLVFFEATLVFLAETFFKIFFFTFISILLLKINL